MNPPGRGEGPVRFELAGSFPQMETGLTLSILKTKLQPPRARPGRVPRPNLVQRLAEGAHRKFPLISAPAGYDKTSLLLS